jgi:L-iditol 2-dehydrogenase
MPMDKIHYNELRVIGSYDSTTAYFEKALRAISTGAIDAKSLISHCYSLEETEKAFKLANSGEGLKIMIEKKEK